MVGLPHRFAFLALALASATAASPLAAVTAAPAAPPACPAVLPLPEAPVALSAGGHYFVYQGKTIPLLGQAAEYLCHVRQPDRAASFCTLDSFAATLDEMARNRNNLLWVWAILNSSPGVGNAARHAPYANEGLIPAAVAGWDLSQPFNDTYLANLERVVCEAYRRNVVVAVTLLDPWSSPWEASPWNRQATVDPAIQGFTSRRLFASFEDPATQTDVAPQNVFTRARQKAAVAAVVERLRKYPNLIWEVANEPDLVLAGVPTTPADVLDWEKAMLAVVEDHDSLPPHLVAVNGHRAATFGWNVAGTQIATTHYPQIVQDPTLIGVLEMLRDSTPSIVAGRATRVVGFNENKAATVPDIPPGHPFYRTADAVRAEAWELALSGGGLFEGYTLDRNGVESRKVLPQLGTLFRFLAPAAAGLPEGIGLADLDAMERATCGAADWCRGLPPVGSSDLGKGCHSALPSRLYWATLKSPTELALYLHHSVFRSTQGGGKFDSYQALPCGDGRSGGYQSSGLQFRVPQPGCWSVRWIDPKTGTTLARETRTLAANAWTRPASFPLYPFDILFFANRLRPGGC